MAIPLVNSVASWFLKKRFHQIDLFLKYPHEVQNELLMSLISISKDTEIGKKFDFALVVPLDFANQFIGFGQNIFFSPFLERSIKF